MSHPLGKGALSLVLAAGLIAVVPSVMADPDCDGPYCCDRDPVEIVRRYLEAGTDIVLEIVTRAGEASGKLKCTAYEMAFLCSDETFPPIVSPFRTNPTGVHGHFSPCFEVFTPGFEHLAGCPTAHALRHRFTPSWDTHACVPLQNIVIPSESLSNFAEA